MRAACGAGDGRGVHTWWTACGRIASSFVPSPYGPFVANTRERNERLAEAMARAGVSSADLAVTVQDDPRTIDRLVGDRSRIPRSHARHAIAEAVHVPVGVLWPAAANAGQATNELSAVYPSRA